MVFLRNFFLPFGVHLDEIKQSSFSKFIFDHHAKSYFQVPKTVSRFSNHVQQLLRKDVFDPLCFVENYDQMSEGGFDPLSNSQIRHFCSIRIKIESKSHIRALNQSRDHKVFKYVFLIQLLLLEWTQRLFEQFENGPKSPFDT